MPGSPQRRTTPGVKHSYVHRELCGDCAFVPRTATKGASLTNLMALTVKCGATEVGSATEADSLLQPSQANALGLAAAVGPSGPRIRMLMLSLSHCIAPTTLPYPQEPTGTRRNPRLKGGEHRINRSCVSLNLQQASVNFMMQRRSFAPGEGLHMSLVKRYLLAEAWALMCCQIECCKRNP